MSHNKIRIEQKAFSLICKRTKVYYLTAHKSHSWKTIPYQKNKVLRYWSNRIHSPHFPEKKIKRKLTNIASV